MLIHIIVRIKSVGSSLGLSSCLHHHEASRIFKRRRVVVAGRGLLSAELYLPALHTDCLLVFFTSKALFCHPALQKKVPERKGSHQGGDNRTRPLPPAWTNLRKILPRRFPQARHAHSISGMKGSTTSPPALESWGGVCLCLNKAVLSTDYLCIYLR